MRDDVHVGWAGTADEGGMGRPIERNTIFRPPSMTKPLTAVAVLALVGECVLRRPGAGVAVLALWS